MARTVRDHRLETRAARLRLPERPEPYWMLLSEGLHLGYYRGKRVTKWVARHRPPGRTGGYEKVTLGEADDASDADGVTMLDYRQAQDKARLWYLDKGAGAKPTTGYTVGSALDDYIEQFTGKDLVNTKRRIEVLIRPVVGSVKVDQLTSDHIEKFRNDRAKTPARLRTAKDAKTQKFRPLDSDEAKRKRKSTANRDMTVLKAALNFAFQRRRIPSDSAWRSVKPFKGADRAKLRYLTDDEARRLVNGAQADFRPILQAALLTGARWGELRKIKATDVDLSSATVWLHDTKGGGSRVCYLEAEGVELFKQNTVGKDGAALVFPRSDGKVMGDAHQIRRMTDACIAAKVTPAASFHDLRRTYGARLALRGVPLAVIAEALGHADERITRRHYAHLSPSFVADTVRANMVGLGIVQPSNTQRIA